MNRDALISECGKYRYSLRRLWDDRKPGLLFVMLNPSTADAEVDDATIRSCIRLSKDMRFGWFEVVNLYAFRATDPKNLLNTIEPIGPGNEDAIKEASFRCQSVVCAWGAHPFARHRERAVLEMLRFRHAPIYCFGKTKSGAPKHPLYIKSGTPLQVFK